MKKLFIILFVITFLLSGCKNNDVENNVDITRTGTMENINPTNTAPVQNIHNTQAASPVTPPKEEQIATYTTPILDKDADRQTNVSLSCEELTGSIVKSEETFSFNEKLGPASPSEGYEKAKSFEADGDVYQEYGGGKCQLSSTLYAAVKDLENIEIIERHAHSSKVYYIAEGLDATVCYGSVDFKFKNNNSYSIRIDATCTDDNVTVTIVKIP